VTWRWLLKCDALRLIVINHPPPGDRAVLPREADNGLQAAQETPMTRFAANLSMLFTEVPLLNRFERAARAGFSCVEIQFPYEATAQICATGCAPTA
jgi:hypothetical protein